MREVNFETQQKLLINGNRSEIGQSSTDTGATATGQVGPFRSLQDMCPLNVFCVWR